MIATGPEISAQRPVRTWFGIGGGAARTARPAAREEVVRCLEIDPKLRVLGDGANLLVDDDGVDELVVELTAPALAGWEIDDTKGLVTVGAGANLPKLINETVRRGLWGLETLAGIPAQIGGALVMNAGGAFGQIADVVERVSAVDRRGNAVELARREIAFEYRRSGLNELIVLGATLRLTPGDAEKLRARQVEIMRYKKHSQPMAEHSAGCVFKNPTLGQALKEAPDAEPGKRVSAGRLIDLAGLKGTRVGGAEVSGVHANFVVTRPGATARDVIELMRTVARRVRERFGVTLEREVVVWTRHTELLAE